MSKIKTPAVNASTSDVIQQETLAMSAVQCRRQRCLNATETQLATTGDYNVSCRCAAGHQALPGISPAFASAYMKPVYLLHLGLAYRSTVVTL